MSDYQAQLTAEKTLARCISIIAQAKLKLHRTRVDPENEHIKALDKAQNEVHAIYEQITNN